MTEEIKLSDLKPDHRNANKGSERGAYMVEQSLRKLGAGRSILLDKNGKIIAGNKTAEAASSIDLDDVVVVRTDGKKLVAVMREDLDLDDDTGLARELAYADNRTSQISLTFDPDVIAADLDMGVDLGDWFQDFELEEIGAMPDEPLEEGDAEPQISRADELQEEWGVELGQMWRLPSRVEGQEHRLICGDCTDGDVVERVMGGEKATLGFTSPPYAMQREDSYGGVPVGDYINWWESIQSNIKSILATDGSFFVNIKAHCDDRQRSLYVMDLVINMVREHNWFFVDELYWKRQGYPGGYTNRFKNAIEPVYHFSATGAVKFRPKNVLGEYYKDYEHKKYQESKSGSGFHTGSVKGEGGARPSNLIEVNQGATATQAGTFQSAVFPVGLPEFFIKAYSDEVDNVCEPFSGSGSTIIAAENLSRQCRAVEISPAYVAVALQRYKDAFGIEPELITQ